MPPVWEAVAVGAGLGFSLAAPPGPVMAKMAFETARGRWQQGTLVGLGAATADATYFALVLFGVLEVLPGRRILGVLAFAGVALMLYFSYGSWRAARRPFEAPRSRLNGMPAGFILAATSPFNMAWWLTSGAPFLNEYGAPLGLGFFSALLATIALAVWFFHHGSRKIARFETYVSYASCVLLAGFAMLLFVTSVRYLAGA